MESLKKDYWENRWKNNETGWHQSEAEPHLQEFFKGAKKGLVFVPLCGKSLDMKWLYDQGHDVVGVELSAMACEGFFKDHQIQYRQKTIGDHTLYVATQKGLLLTLIQGDFFSLSDEVMKGALGQKRIGCIYDRAALIALPPQVRSNYQFKLVELIKTFADPSNPQDLRFLQILLYREPHDEKGPPFSVRPSDLKPAYSKYFEFKDLGTEEVPGKPGSAAKVLESVWSLSLRN